MRQDAHTAAAALPVAGFGHGRAAVALGNSRVKFAQIFWNGSDDFFAFGGGGVELFLLLPAQRLNFFSLGGNGLLGFFQPRLLALHAPFTFFRGLHSLALSLIRLCNFSPLSSISIFPTFL